MELSDKDLKDLASSRMPKKVQWNRKYTIPCYLLLVIFAVCLLVPSNHDIERTMISDNGNKVVVMGGSNEMTIDGIEYTNLNKYNRIDVINYAGYLALLGALIVYVLWRKRVKQPYTKKFVEYYKNHGELMSADEELD